MKTPLNKYITPQLMTKIERAFVAVDIKARLSTGILWTCNYEFRIPIHQGSSISNENILKWFSLFFVSKTKGGGGLYSSSAALIALTRRIVSVSKQWYVQVRFTVLWALPQKADVKTELDGLSNSTDPSSTIRAIERGLQTGSRYSQRKRMALFYYDRNAAVSTNPMRMRYANFRMIVC